MKRVLFALVFLTALVPKPSLGAGSVEVVNLMPAFFAADAPGVSLAMRVRRFKERVLYPNAPLFDVPYFALDDPHLAWYLDGLTTQLPAIHTATDAIATALPADAATFERALPKFDPGSVSVYLLPSMGIFDGMTRDVGGKRALLLGIDAVSKEGVPIGVLLDHELFHVYHHEINPSFFVTPSEDDLHRFGLHRQVWAEGLAVYASRVLNPSASDADVLESRALATMTDADTRKLACLVAAHFEATDVRDADELFDGGRHPEALPPRGGYAIGYLVARELGKTRSLSALADLQGQELHDVVAGVVRGLCGG